MSKSRDAVIAVTATIIFRCVFQSDCAHPLHGLGIF